MANDPANAQTKDYGGPSRRKRTAGLFATLGSMAVWNPVSDLLGGLAQGVVGELAYRTCSLAILAGQLVWNYKRDLADELLDDVGSTVTDIPYRLERVDRAADRATTTPTGLAFRMAIPDLLSLSRPAIGLWAAVFLWNGGAIQAFIFYSIGIITDVVDGWLARRLTGGTSWGKDLDGITDSAMNLFVFAAVIGVGLREGETWFVVAAVVLVLLWVGTRLFTAKHSVAAKFRSGVTRGVLYVAIVATLPSPWWWIGLGVGAVMLAVGGRYELAVTKRERESGARPDWGEGWVQRRIRETRSAE